VYGEGVVIICVVVDSDHLSPRKQTEACTRWKLHSSLTK
jgi:hypothetical protein